MDKKLTNSGPGTPSTRKHSISSQAWLSGFDSPVRLRLGGGAAHATWCDHRRLSRSQSGCPINRQGSGINGLGVPWRSQMQPRKASRTLT